MEFRTMRALSAAALALALGFAQPAAAQDFSPEAEARIKALAIEALLEQPEILRELVSRLEAKEAAEASARARDALSALGPDLFEDPNAPALGADDADVTIVEFMDYNCGFCKRAAPEVAALKAADPKVRVVLREWPILGEGSVAAARVALAAREQGAYAAVHAALMARPRVDEAAALAVAAELGLDLEKLKADMGSDAVEEHIAQSMRLAQALGINGTPAFVIGDQVLGGLTPADELIALVAEVRAATQ